MKRFILCFLSFTIAQVGFTQSKNLDSIKITYVNCYIETIVGISCSQFDYQLADEKKYKTLKTLQIIPFKNTFREFIKVNWNSIDVRGKIEFSMQGKKYKYCFDRFGKFTERQNFYTNSRLFKLIKQAIPDFCDYVYPKSNPKLRK